MKKKTKKLQFKKETVAILDGGKMTNVIGDNLSPEYSKGPETFCHNGGEWICINTTPTFGYCKCKPTYGGVQCDDMIA